MIIVFCGFLGQIQVCFCVGVFGVCFGASTQQIHLETTLIQLVDWIDFVCLLLVLLVGFVVCCGLFPGIFRLESKRHIKA